MLGFIYHKPFPSADTRRLSYWKPERRINVSRKYKNETSNH